MARSVRLLGCCSLALLLLLSCQSTSSLEESSELYYRLGNALVASGELNQARAAYQQAIARNGGYEDALYNLARVLIDLNEYEAAGSYASRLVGKEPQELRYRLLEAYILQFTQGIESALQAYIRIAEDEDDSTLTEDVVSLALEAGLYDTAYGYGLEAFEKGRYSARLLFLLGEAKRLSGDQQTASSWYEAAVLEDGSLTPALGQVVAGHADDDDPETLRQLEELLLRAVEKNPGDAALRFIQARLSLTLGKEIGLDQAKRAFSLGFDDHQQVIDLSKELSQELSLPLLELADEAGLIHLVMVPEGAVLP